MENKIKVVESNDIYTIYTFLKFKLNLQKSNSSCNPYIPVVVIWFCGIITFWLIIHYWLTVDSLEKLYDGHTGGHIKPDLSSRRTKFSVFRIFIDLGFFVENVTVDTAVQIKRIRTPQQKRVKNNVKYCIVLRQASILSN